MVLVDVAECSTFCDGFGRGAQSAFSPNVPRFAMVLVNFVHSRTALKMRFRRMFRVLLWFWLILIDVGALSGGVFA